MRDHPIGLVIFDCDGVLVDSEPLAMRVLVESIARQGVTIAPEVAFRDFLGRSLASISQSLNASHGIHLDHVSLEAMRGDLYALYRKELRPSGWIADAIDKLEVPFCVASSSSIERVRVSLEITGLLPRFEGKIFSASMVTRGKPAPDLFLHAAATMGVPPEDCIVIEDSPAGMRAAQAAGMRVFAYLGGGHIEAAALAAQAAAIGPDATFADMRLLPGLVALHQARGRGTAPRLLAAIDVGTASARAGILDAAGNTLARTEHPIDMRQEGAIRAEHNSEQIWTAVGIALRAAVARSGVRAEEVAGLSFDATCSLVVRDTAGVPLAVSADGAAEWDTIAWFDHRAQAEAEECTISGDPVLDGLGGVMSPEMQVPKLMWLKRHLPESWQQIGFAFDLGDFLTWKATGSTERSHCTLACKWTYQPSGWPLPFLAAMGLDDLLPRCGLPYQSTPVGGDLGPLTPAAAEHLGLTTACRVATAMVDAHAGALGILGGTVETPAALPDELVLIAGTSSAIMALSPDRRPIAGTWGPFADAVAPGTWLNEAGQSATGALLDHIVRTHGSGGEPTPQRHRAIQARIAELRSIEGQRFAADLHILPDFHGNRSPEADPGALGVISGLSMDGSFDGLCRLYFATALAIALQVRQLLEVLAANGYGTDRLHIAGGHRRNPLLLELYADAAGTSLLLPNAVDATLLGDAIVAAAACGIYPSLVTAGAAMAQGSRPFRPDAATAPGYETEYRVFLRMIAHRRELDAFTRGATVTER